MNQSLQKMIASTKNMVIGLILSILLLCSGNANGQSIILELLYGQAHNVFLGKVEHIKYSTSNAQGSEFNLSVNVLKFYKGEDHFDNVRFGSFKPEIIDLEFDSLIMDYSFQITQDSTYIFFTGKIKNHKNLSPKSGYTQITDSRIEGVPFSPGLEQIIKTYNRHNSINFDNTGYITPYNVIDLMSTNSASIFIGNVLKITKKDDELYTILINTKSGEIPLKVKNTNCICVEGSLKIGHAYKFYTNKLGQNDYRLIDAWLGAIQATEYEKFELNN